MSDNLNKLGSVVNVEFEYKSNCGKKNCKECKDRPSYTRFTAPPIFKHSTLSLCMHPPSHAINVELYKSSGLGCVASSPKVMIKHILDNGILDALINSLVQTKINYIRMTELEKTDG